MDIIIDNIELTHNGLKIKGLKDTALCKFLTIQILNNDEQEVAFKNLDYNASDPWEVDFDRNQISQYCGKYITLKAFCTKQKNIITTKKILLDCEKNFKCPTNSLLLNTECKNNRTLLHLRTDEPINSHDNLHSYTYEFIYDNIVDTDTSYNFENNLNYTYQLRNSQLRHIKLKLNSPTSPPKILCEYTIGNNEPIDIETCPPCSFTVKLQVNSENGNEIILTEDKNCYAVGKDDYIQVIEPNNGNYTYVWSINGMPTNENSSLFQVTEDLNNANISVVVTDPNTNCVGSNAIQICQPEQPTSNCSAISLKVIDSQNNDVTNQECYENGIYKIKVIEPDNLPYEWTINNIINQENTSSEYEIEIQDNEIQVNVKNYCNEFKEIILTPCIVEHISPEPTNTNTGTTTDNTTPPPIDISFNFCWLWLFINIGLSIAVAIFIFLLACFWSSPLFGIIQTILIVLSIVTVISFLSWYLICSFIKAKQVMCEMLFLLFETFTLLALTVSLIGGLISLISFTLECFVGTILTMGYWGVLAGIVHYIRLSLSCQPLNLLDYVQNKYTQLKELIF